MRALILAGGRGRRLGPFTALFPKPLAPVGEIPIIDILLQQLRRHGITTVHVSIGHLGALIEAYFMARGEIDGLELRYLREATPLGTAGPVRMLADAGEPVLVVNGDLLTTFDFRRFICFYEERRPTLAIAVIRRETTLDLGVVQASESGEVVGYLEKPTLEHLCGMGINIYSPEAIASIADGESIDMPTLTLRLLERGLTVLSYRSDCYWMDIGRRDDYERALEDFPGMRAELLPAAPRPPP